MAKKFRSRLLLSGIILAAALLLSFLAVQVTSSTLPGEAAFVEEAFNVENLIRLHVLANSDSPADQELKLKVRDAVLAETGHLLTGAATKAEAWEKLELNREVLQAAAQNVVNLAGKNYPVEVRLGEYHFPERTYGTLRVPAGDYQAVKVVIGEGRGRNWWCVLFPPLCLLEGAGEAHQPVVRQQKAADQGEHRQVVVEWRLKYFEGLYRDYSQKLAAFLHSVRNRAVLSAQELSS
ncbi:MAG TPA: stage II sporulation protein R [Firmicutes bacterium]|nr:stage II sporulation protein R [Bacillota bacterium]